MMMSAKIKSPKILKKIFIGLRKKGKRIGFTNGCFDILHYGHVKCLQEAKRYADILVVALNTDSSVKRLKGRRRPISTLKDRMRVIAALESVDYVTYFSEDTPRRIITFLKPDIIIKGSDYKTSDIVGNDIVSSYGGSVKRINYIRGYSDTALIKRIASRCRR